MRIVTLLLFLILILSGCASIPQSSPIPERKEISKESARILKRYKNISSKKSHKPQDMTLLIQIIAEGQFDGKQTFSMIPLLAPATQAKSSWEYLNHPEQTHGNISQSRQTRIYEELYPKIKETVENYFTSISVNDKKSENEQQET